MQEQDGYEVEIEESWKICEGLKGWLRKRWWWWWWSCGSTFNIWLKKGVLGKTRNRPSFSLPPPPPPHGMVPKPAFCSILHENVVFAVFLARWVAGAVRKPANSWDFLQPTFRKRAICNVSASTSWSSAVSPASMSNYHIILNLLSYSLVNRSDICLYLIPVKLSLRVTSFPYLNSLSFFS